MHEETKGLSKLGRAVGYEFSQPGPHILEAFANRYPQRDYIVTFTHPEFTSLCPMTGQPDFAVITLKYVPELKCVESKSFKLYMTAYRNHGAFMESIINNIADDLIQVLQPRRLSLVGVFNPRGGTSISVQVHYLAPELTAERKLALAALW